MAKKSESASGPNLKCDQCSYENEAERVYCHNCGAKLDRSLLPVGEAHTQKIETPEQARKRIAKMTNPQASAGMRVFKTALNVLLYSALVAALFLIAQKPDDVPEVSRELSDRSVGGDLMDAASSPKPARLEFTEAEINAYFKQQIKQKDSAVPGLKFQRAFVNLLPGAIRIGWEQSLFDLPLYSSVLYRLEVKDGKFTPMMLGGSFGRLAVHPKIMEYADVFFQKLWVVLQPQHKQMEKMQSVSVQKGTVTLVTKGTVP